MTREELANKITKAYRKAFEEGTDKAWKTYHRKLKKWAEEVDAISPEALEDWALEFVRNFERL